MQFWIASGAQLAWMIDPFFRTASIYRPGAPPEVLGNPDFVIADAVAPGFTLGMAELWDREPPAASRIRTFRR